MSARDRSYDRIYELPNFFLTPKRDEYPHLPTALGTALVYGVLFTAVIYQVLHYLDYYPVLSIPELLWYILVYITPLSLVSALDQSSPMAATDEPGKEGLGLESKGFAAKSDAMRRILGLDGASLFAHFRRARSLSGISTAFKGAATDNIPGLGNWDNSCYQNSVLQGLAALPSLSAFLDKAIYAERKNHGHSTIYALKDIITNLNDPTNAGKRFWTPAELKSMSSWQQQDAQEYYSKVMDEVEKEVSRVVENKPVDGGLAEAAMLVLERPSNDVQSEDVKKELDPTKTSEQRSSTTKFTNLGQLPSEIASILLRNPLEGLLAQRVGCIKCGFVEGLSLIPFNCLTVPLGKQWLYDIRSCLDDYSALEPINGVECAKCTLLRNKEQLERLISQTTDPPRSNDQAPQLSNALRTAAEIRLCAVNSALEDRDFSETSLLKKCQIPVNSRVTTTKTRQAVVARAPKSLVIHVNRSVFDEHTGMQSKNYADVQFPNQLDLAPWCLGNQQLRSHDQDGPEQWNVNPRESMLCDDADPQPECTSTRDSRMYELRAAITHSGRHENGHYICYRRHPYTLGNGDNIASEPRGERWWRLSDDEVSEFDEENVLAQGGVFMLFYESIEDVMPSRRSSRVGLHERSSVELGTNIFASAKVQRSVESSISTLDTPLDESVSDHLAQAAEPTSLPAQPIPSAELPQTPLKEPDANLAAQIIHTPSDPIRQVRTIEGTTTLEPQTSAPPKADISKEDQRIATPMRTAGLRKGRGSVRRAGKGMTAVSSMVRAN